MIQYPIHLILDKIIVSLHTFWPIQGSTMINTSKVKWHFKHEKFITIHVTNTSHIGSLAQKQKRNCGSCGQGLNNAFKVYQLKYTMVRNH